MKDIAVSELRKHLTAKIDEVARTGEALVLTRRGQAVAKLAPIDAMEGDRASMSLRGVPIGLSDDFDAPLSELWEGLAAER